VGYELYVTRADSHLETREKPISESEWLAAASADPTLSLSNEDYYERRGPDKTTERFHPWIWSAHPDTPPLWFIDGAINVKNPDPATISKLVELARILKARVIGEEGEEYTE